MTGSGLLSSLLSRVEMNVIEVGEMWHCPRSSTLPGLVASVSYVYCVGGIGFLLSCVLKISLASSNFNVSSYTLKCRS